MMTPQVEVNKATMINAREIAERMHQTMFGFEDFLPQNQLGRNDGWGNWLRLAVDVIDFRKNGANDGIPDHHSGSDIKSYMVMHTDRHIVVCILLYVSVETDMLCKRSFILQPHNHFL
jgi:hypothetical protein